MACKKQQKKREKLGISLPILASEKLCNFLGFPLSDKATAHERILSTPRDFKKCFSCPSSSL
jgi:hypothetical protein